MKDHNLSKLQKTFKMLGWILVTVSGLTLMIALSRGGLGYYWLLISPLIAIAVYMLAPRSSWIARLASAYFPFAKELTYRQEQIDHNIVVVEKMGYTLKYYELCDIDAADGLRDRMINSLPEVNTDAGRLENCAGLATAHLNSSRPTLPHQLLMLLYQDHHSSPPAVLWTKEKEALIPPLAEILSTSSHLKSRHELTYKKNDLEYFLEKVNIFKLNEVKKEIEELNELWSVIRDYLAFLHEHQIASRQRVPTPKGILRLLKEDERPLDPNKLDKTLHRILLAFGARAIRSAFRNERKELINSFSLISLILFLKHKPDLRAHFCRKASDDKPAARITFAYLEFNEDLHTRVKLDGNDFVSLNYLIKNWAGRVEEKEKSLDGFQKEIETIQTTLSHGEWIISLPFMIQRALHKIAQDTESMRSDIKTLKAERPFIVESLKRVFGNLKLETVERYLEARTINAYLITFSSPGGSLATVLNCMVSDYKQPALEKYGISTTVNAARRYNYKQYTNNGRIGIVPKGLSFEEFQEGFQKDFTILVDNRRELIPKPPRTEKRIPGEIYWNWDERDLEDVELILHRFGLSGRNYYGFIAMGITKAHAIARVKELFADLLDENELFILINYEKDEPGIIEAVMDGPITELVADQKKLDPLEIKAFKKKIEDERDVDQQLRTEIFQSLGCRTGKELGHQLLLADDRRLEHTNETAGKILQCRLSGTVPGFDDKRSLAIAETYLGTLRALAGLDKPR